MHYNSLNNFLAQGGYYENELFVSVICIYLDC